MANKTEIELGKANHTDTIMDAAKNTETPEIMGKPPIDGPAGSAACKELSCVDPTSVWIVCI